MNPSATPARETAARCCHSARLRPCVVAAAAAADAAKELLVSVSGNRRLIFWLLVFPRKYLHVLVLVRSLAVFGRAPRDFTSAAHGVLTSARAGGATSLVSICPTTSNSHACVCNAILSQALQREPLLVVRMGTQPALAALRADRHPNCHVQRKSHRSHYEEPATPRAVSVQNDPVECSRRRSGRMRTLVRLAVPAATTKVAVLVAAPTPAHAATTVCNARFDSSGQPGRKATVSSALYPVAKQLYCPRTCGTVVPLKHGPALGIRVDPICAVLQRLDADGDPLCLGREAATGRNPHETDSAT